MEEGRVPWTSWSLVTKCTHVQLDYCLRATKGMPRVTSPRAIQGNSSFISLPPTPSLSHHKD